MVVPCLNTKLHCYKCNYGVLWLSKGQETATPHSYLSKTAQLVSLATGVSHAAAAMQQIQKLTHEFNPGRLIDHSLHIRYCWHTCVPESSKHVAGMVSRPGKGSLLISALN